MEKPLVTIVVPIYDTEAYLHRCIDSLISQTYRNLEIILVDDGSTDNSGAICDEYSTIDTRIRTIHRENGGLSAARCSGLSAATGEYICIVDSDDWIDVKTIEACVMRAIDNNADCVMFSYTKEYPTRSIPIHLMDGDQSFIGALAEEKVYRRLFGLLDDELTNPANMDNVGSCCMKLYRYEIAKKGRFFDTEEVGSSEDTLFNMYALYGAHQIEYMDEPYYHYFKNPNSLTNTFRPRLIQQWDRLFSVIGSIINEKQLGERYRQALNSRIVFSIYGIGTNELLNPDQSSFRCMKNLKHYLTSNRYRYAWSNFSFKELPLIWKIFFGCCKYRIAWAVYLQLRAMQILKRRK